MSVIRVGQLIVGFNEKELIVSMKLDESRSVSGDSRLMLKSPNNITCFFSLLILSNTVLMYVSIKSDFVNGGCL